MIESYQNCINSNLKLNTFFIGKFKTKYLLLYLLMKTLVIFSAFYVCCLLEIVL